MSGWTPGEKTPKNKEKRYFYLKLTASFFKDKAIKKLRKLPGGDTYALITLEIFLEALENDSHLYYDGIEDSFAKELALSLDETPEAIQMALDFLLSCGWLVEESKDDYFAAKGAEMAGSITARGFRKQRQKERERIASPEQSSALVPPEFRKVPASSVIYSNSISSSNSISNSRSDRCKEEELASKPLPELYPEAFISSKQKVIPTLSEVSDYAAKTGIHLVDPDLFFSTFSSSDWMADGKDITDWKTLYIALELDAITAASGVTE